MSKSDTPQGVEIGTVVKQNIATQPGPRGGKLQIGNPGNKGGSGRPSNALRIRLGSIAEKFAKSADSLEVAGNPNHPQWLGLGKFAVEMVEGKPNQTMQVDAQVQIVVSQGIGVRQE